MERYRSLELEEDYVDPEKEEGKEGAAIHFNYDQENSNSMSDTALAPTVFVQDEPEPPSLKTLANVLEKTTEFIAKNGAQMEILMRAKEAGNLKFQFLNPDNPYHPIYKQVLEKKRQRNKNPYLYNEKACNQGELSLEDVEASLRRLTRNLPSAAPNPTTPDGTSSPSYGNGGGSAYSRLVEKVSNISTRIDSRRIKCCTKYFAVIQIILWQIREKKAEAAAKDAAKNTMSSAGPSENSTPVPSPSPSVSAEETGLSENSNNKIDQTEGTEEHESVIEVIPPPLDIQILIDKTASWVCKENLKSENKQSGEERLSIVKKLHKDKFDFLFTGNKYHNYYLFKIALYTEMLNSQTKTILQDTSQTLADKPELTDNLSSKITSESNDCRQLSESSGKSFPTLKGFFN